MAMRYEEVNQLAVSKASKSAAIDDWVVVRMEIFVAWRKIKRPTDPTISDPLNVEMAASPSLPSLSDKLGDVERRSRGARSDEAFKTAMM
jgi:hypothetical protein